MRCVAWRFSPAMMPLAVDRPVMQILEEVVKEHVASHMSPGTPGGTPGKACRYALFLQPDDIGLPPARVPDEVCLKDVPEFVQQCRQDTQPRFVLADLPGQEEKQRLLSSIVEPDAAPAREAFPELQRFTTKMAAIARMAAADVEAEPRIAVQQHCES